jgi:hypothetical protein
MSRYENYAAAPAAPNFLAVCSCSEMKIPLFLNRIIMLSFTKAIGVGDRWSNSSPEQT